VQDPDKDELRIAGLSISEMPPEMLATVCPLEVFVIMLAERCPTFSQRRSLFKRLKEVEQRLKDLEAKMIRMEVSATQPLRAAAFWFEKTMVYHMCSKS
jgi:citrate synthase